MKRPVRVVVALIAVQAALAGVYWLVRGSLLRKAVSAVVEPSQGVGRADTA